jgi:hypothetical protein
VTSAELDVNFDTKVIEGYAHVSNTIYDAALMGLAAQDYPVHSQEPQPLN